MTSRALLAVALIAAASPAAAQRAPAPAAVNLPADVVAVACAPRLVFEAPAVPLRVAGSQESTVHRTMAPGDLITINAGTENGIDIGQEFYTRRVLPLERRPISRENPATVRTSGWIRVYAVDPQMSLATIVHACDAVELGDYLEPFSPPSVPAPSANRPPAQRDNYGRVLIGNDNRAAFARGDFFVVDRGSDHGVAAGDHFVIYRDKRVAGNFLFDIGEAVAIEVGPDTSTLRATVTRDAFLAGDYVAIRKEPEKTEP